MPSCHRRQPPLPPTPSFTFPAPPLKAAHAASEEEDLDSARPTTNPKIKNQNRMNLYRRTARSSSNLRGEASDHFHWSSLFPWSVPGSLLPINHSAAKTPITATLRMLQNLPEGRHIWTAVNACEAIVSEEVAVFSCRGGNELVPN